VVAVLALLVAAGAVAGFVYDGRDGPAPANARAAPAPPDPFLYIATGNLLHLSREQTCDGLFGRCLGPPPDGDPDTEMWVIGRVPKMLGSPPDPCPGAEDNYAYNKLQPLSDQAPVTSVTVATIESDSGQSAEPSC
jgi:hypothetical protein